MTQKCNALQENVDVYMSFFVAFFPDFCYNTDGVIA